MSQTTIQVKSIIIGIPDGGDTDALTSVVCADAACILLPISLPPISSPLVVNCGHETSLLVANLKLVFVTERSVFNACRWDFTRFHAKASGLSLLTDSL